MPGTRAITEGLFLIEGDGPRLLAARALGLGTTLSTLHRGFENDLKALLDVPAAVEVVALVPLGHPADRFGPTRRKPVDRVAFRDRWGKPFVAGGA